MTVLDAIVRKPLPRSKITQLCKVKDVYSRDKHNLFVAFKDVKNFGKKQIKARNLSLKSSLA